MKEPKTILVTYNYFLPAYKAGGPIQSLANMVRYLKGGLNFKVLCSANEYATNLPLGITPDTWVDFENGCASVFYVSPKKESFKTLKRLLNQTQFDLLFINGIFNVLYNIYPIILSKTPILLSARGMLHPGGLSQKSLKKKIFINSLKLWGITKKISFHATDDKEKEYIKNVFGDNAQVFVCPNLPRLFERSPTCKEAGLLKICSIALISPMKNHLQIIKALTKVKATVKYDIYGPIKDPVYWDECLAEINKLPANISVCYHGDLNPGLVEPALKNCDLFILPSKSENYGHAFVEALSAGKPVITSHNTPWQNLDNLKAGWNVNPDNIDELAKAIEAAADLSIEDFALYSQHASDYIQKKIDIDSIVQQYSSMFESMFENDKSRKHTTKYS